MKPKLTNPIVTILTDFGTKDAYVGVMKGVMQRYCPGVISIDMTHDITPQSIEQAAFVLWTAYRFYPAGTVFLVVVDPGVGADRKAVAVEAGGYQFIAPDNGVLTDVLFELGAYKAVEISPADDLPVDTSNTFHGRDVFAPAAAKLASGIPLTAMGPEIKALKHMPAPTLDVKANGIDAEVIYIDHFGNAITSIGTCTWQDDGSLNLMPRLTTDAKGISMPANVNVSIAQHTFATIHPTYAAVPQGSAAPIIGSSGQLEIAVNQGNAAQQLQLSVGTKIALNW